MPNILWNVAVILAKAATDRVLGADRTDELTAALSAWWGERADYPAEETPNLFERVGQESFPDAPEEQATAELALAAVAPELPLVLADQNLTPRQAAEQLLQSLPKQSGTFIVWLERPYLLDPGCFCHFYWKWNKDSGKTAFTIRDLYHGRVYYGKRESKPRPTKYLRDVQDWNRYSALDIWHAACPRVRCKGVLEFSVTGEENEGFWKATLEDLTRGLPRSPGDGVAGRTALAEKALRDALEQYRRPDGYEGHLVESAWQLEQIGREAWPVLGGLILGGGPECEYFLGAIVRLEGVAPQERLAALLAAARSPIANVRSRLLELLDEVPVDLRKELLRELTAKDRPDDSVTDRAREAWHEWAF